MNELRFGTELQTAFRNLAYQFGSHLCVAATLTLKTHAKIRVRRFENVCDDFFEFNKKLDDEIINKTARRFTARLTHHLYGNQSKHKGKKNWAKPLVLIAIEGRNKNKRTHFHIAVGNIPEDKLQNIEQIITRAWHECDFGNEQVCTKLLTDKFGWLDYMTKEVGYTDNDALAIEHTCIPEFITNNCCIESR
jgi:hypothetical protein